MLTVTDRRIGIRNKDTGKIIKVPTHYANDRIWNKTANPTPTLIYFGKDKNYFYVLPVASKRIPTHIYKDLLRAIGEDEKETIISKTQTLSSIKEQMGIKTPLVETKNEDIAVLEQSSNENKETIEDLKKEQDKEIIKTNSGFEVKKN